ncbi:hypothetical protein I317_06884 [Kwoniella heveanensis CBS 569]|uniref:Xylanolytic transcriptional activator regulatory domain-containing protein n=1 Tax=Kwoniella heveanensis BCC8398 TaxID=1296120 RepID=A0A1B9GYP4_9TREE|nr:hypothetical protein I316_02002 [Kwoniella heveanensis BCC8398]OCF39302.1 hypothetical protein I317_06884 [Kwoniella heveanensis CBS 569]
MPTLHEPRPIEPNMQSQLLSSAVDGPNGHNAQAAQSSSSASYALTTTGSVSVKDSIDTNLSWLDSLMDDTASFPPIPSIAELRTDSRGNPVEGPAPLDSGQAEFFFSDQAQLLFLESPVDLQAHSNVSGGNVDLTTSHVTGRAEPQLEDLTSWANFSHFIALFLRYLYPLLPLVHRPTFAEQLATRRDLVDTDFRALLLSIVAYVISQLPTSRLVNDQFDIEGLKRLQRRCHRTCKALQRTYYGPTSCTQIATIIFDTFYLLSIGLGHTAGARLGQAIQLAYSMGMHSDAKTEALGLDPIEIQLRRRVFWQLYANDKTRAISGLPMMINDFQGVCSMPDPVDDEFITTQGSFPQPPSKPSPIAGFVRITKLFRILSECFFHHRCVISNMQMIDTAWTVAAEDRLHQLLREVAESGTSSSSQDSAVAGGMDLGGNNSSGNVIIRNMLAVQRANVLITAAICKFALYDLRTALQLDKEQLAKEREGIAREIHSSLTTIPVEDLASNGESVRCKIFHIVCALCSQDPASGVDQDLIRDWYNMVSVSRSVGTQHARVRVTV